jgi:hypothetical protein
MGLLDLASNALRGVTEKLQRNAIGYSIYGICGLAVLILSTSAGVMALIPLVGAVYAQLIAAGVFLVVIAGTALWLQRTAGAPARAVPAAAAAAAATEGAPKQLQFAQLAMIIEAVMLGYSMSRRR